MVQDQVASDAWGRIPVRDPRVLEAMSLAPRHLFVPADLQALAYADRPLPIGEGQTISQPYIVARSVEALELEPGDRVLEVGAGCGYQAAVLAELGAVVTALEIVPGLARACAERLEHLGYSDRVQVHHSDGFDGWPDDAPYRGIVLACATPEVPPPLWDQLASGGCLVAPVGPVGRYQQLVRRRRLDDGGVEEEVLDTVRFVPLTRAEYTRP
jgi:protein-L-isoaspartate(D-aspartate) O-methyltransferase